MKKKILVGFILLGGVVSCGGEVVREPQSVETSPETLIEEPVLHEESLPAEEEGRYRTALLQHRDSFHSMISHFELRAEKELSSVEVDWKVSGGRYHIVDDELPHVAAAQPLRRSVQFRERARYHIQADVYKEGVRIASKGFSLDLRRPAEYQDITHMPRVVLEIDKLSVTAGKKLTAWSSTTIDGAVNNVWEVRRVQQGECSEAALQKEDLQAIHVKMAIQKICDRQYEELLEPNRDYKVIQKTASHLEVRLNDPGLYTLIYKAQTKEGLMIDETVRHVEVTQKKFAVSKSQW